MLAKLILVAGLVGLGSSFLFRQVKWDGLRVTFGVNLSDPNVFASLPRTEGDADKLGWTKIADCDESSKFRGKRYVKDNDYAVVMLYDSQGFVAGIQCGCDISMLSTGATHFLVVLEVKWDGLRVTFGVNLSDPNVFASLPRTEGDADKLGWTKIADCDESSKFRGKRYVKDNDYAVVMLYDSQGFVAGIQCGIAKAGLPSYYPPQKQIGQMFQDDGDHYTLTAYFVPPDIICKAGRTHKEFSQDGTGVGLYLQNGSNPVTNAIHIPSTQSSLDANAAPWRPGLCFPAMGVHYVYDVATDMNCDDIQPVFLLYNKKQLTAFGWVMVVDQTSKRFEHLPHASISAFVNSVPTCLYNYETVSSMHIYMTENPSQNLC